MVAQLLSIDLPLSRILVLEEHTNNMNIQTISPNHSTIFISKPIVEFKYLGVNNINMCQLYYKYHTIKSRYHSILTHRHPQQNPLWHDLPQRLPYTPPQSLQQIQMLYQ